MTTTLVAVSGMSPAIVTESLWALAQETPPTIPDEVVVITTSRGESDIQSQLLAPMAEWGNQSVWQTLRHDLLERAGLPAGSPKLQLSVRTIDLPDPAAGVRRPAPDLRTRADNDEAANFIVQTLAPLCDAADQHVVASIAGGRKTMGALLYAAMSLLGKESDRATHVLVSEPFENCRGFFYPAQPHQALEARPFGQPATSVRAEDAVIELADIPFVPLRNKFSELDEPRRTFAGLVAAYSKARRGELRQPPCLSLDSEEGVLSVEGRPIALAGRDLLIAAFLHERALGGHPHFANKDRAKAELADFMSRWKREHPFHQAVARLSGGAAGIDDIPKALASLRKKLKAAGLAAAIPYLAPERSRIGFDLLPG